MSKRVNNYGIATSVGDPNDATAERYYNRTGSLGDYYTGYQSAGLGTDLATGGISAGIRALNNANEQNAIATSAGNNAWTSFGLDPNMYSGSVRNQKKGLEMSTADLQAAALSQNMSERAALLEYDLSKQMYDETQSYQAQVAQMSEAGLNPALLYGSSVSSTGGADAPSVDTSGASNSGSAVSGSAQDVAKGQLFLGAFREAMAIPAQYEQVRSMKLQNDLDESMAGYYQRQIIATTESQEAQAKSAVANAFVEQQTAEDKVKMFKSQVEEQSYKTQASEFGVSESEWKSALVHTQAVMAEKDSEYQTRFLDYQLQIKASESAIKQAEQDNQPLLKKKLIADINNAKQQLKNMVADCAKTKQDTRNAEASHHLLTEEVQDKMFQNDTAMDRFFLDYMDCANDYIDSWTGMATISGNSVGFQELKDGAIGSMLETIKVKFGDTGAYQSAHTKSHYNVMTPSTLNFKGYPKVKTAPYRKYSTTYVDN